MEEDDGSQPANSLRVGYVGEATNGDWRVEDMHLSMDARIVSTADRLLHPQQPHPVVGRRGIFFSHSWADFPGNSRQSLIQIK